MTARTFAFEKSFNCHVLPSAPGSLKSGAGEPSASGGYFVASAAMTTQAEANAADDVILTLSAGFVSVVSIASAALCAATLGAAKHDAQLLVGFAADEGERGLARAREKLDRKHADLFVYNDVARADIGFDAAENAVTLITQSGERAVPKAPKDEIAASILDALESLLA